MHSRANPTSRGALDALQLARWRSAVRLVHVYVASSHSDCVPVLHDEILCSHLSIFDLITARCVVIIKPQEIIM